MSRITRGGFAPWATWAMAQGVAQFFCLNLNVFSTKNWPTSPGTMPDVLVGWWLLVLAGSFNPWRTRPVVLACSFNVNPLSLHASWEPPAPSREQRSGGELAPSTPGYALRLQPSTDPRPAVWVRRPRFASPPSRRQAGPRPPPHIRAPAGPA
jgi:hypothetical protein